MSKMLGWHSVSEVILSFCGWVCFTQIILLSIVFVPRLFSFYHDKNANGLFQRKKMTSWNVMMELFVTGFLMELVAVPNMEDALDAQKITRICALTHLV